MSATDTTVRIAVQTVAPDGYAAMARFSNEATKGLDPGLTALVFLRVSQINGCAYCLEMHAAEGRAAGLDQRAVDTLPAWRESPLFTPAQKAALGLAEAITHLGPHGVPDEAYDEAARHYDAQGLAALVLTSVAINAWNRIAISTGMAAKLAP